MLFETLKKSILSVKKSDTSDSVHTLTEDTPKSHTDFSEPKEKEPLIFLQNDKLALEFEQVVREHDNFVKKSDVKESNFFNVNPWIFLFSVIVAGYTIYYSS
jgi:hypothetical protein